MKKGHVVQLTMNEVQYAVCVGVRRRMESLKNGYQELRGIAEKSAAVQWHANVIGAIAEFAFAKGAGLHWPATVNAKKNDPDVPPYWQVRWRGGANYDLIVRPDDSNDCRYALMTGDNATFTFRGWILGSEAKKHVLEDRHNRNEPAHWVPQGALLSMSKNEP